MKHHRITPQKVRDIIEGARLANAKVASIEVEGMVVKFVDGEAQETEEPETRGHNVKW